MKLFATKWTDNTRMKMLCRVTETCRLNSETGESSEFYNSSVFYCYCLINHLISDTLAWNFMERILNRIFSIPCLKVFIGWLIYFKVLY